MELTWAGIGVIVAITSHGAFSVWWASKITNQIENLSKALQKVDSELEKRDVQIAASWKKIDSINQRLTIVETKCHLTHQGEVNAE